MKGAGDENFPVASALLPGWARPHVMRFYAFARAADDVADSDSLSIEQKRASLNAMARDIAMTLGPSLAETGVSDQYARNLVAAFRRDAENPRTVDWADLMAYCALSAAPVGRYLVELMGGAEDGWETASDSLCAALQVLNHIQDVRDDFVRLGRVYVPADWMRAHGVVDADLAGASCAPGLRAVLDRMLDGVDRLLADARPLPVRIRSRRLGREAGGILAIAGLLARRLRRRDPLAERVELGRVETMAVFAWGVLRS
ncbi:MAG: squalene/phytoene synthase family protein [Alphaproteobacteria bacterium]|nr:squalene/phytoene synthase family protein [Alphaproteobacteria bacterium]